MYATMANSVFLPDFFRIDFADAVPAAPLLPVPAENRDVLLLLLYSECSSEPGVLPEVFDVVLVEA